MGQRDQTDLDWRPPRVWPGPRPKLVREGRSFLAFFDLVLLMLLMVGFLGARWTMMAGL